MDDKPKNKTKPDSNAPKKVLIVEDDDNLATVYLTRLQVEGFDVRREPDGENALATAVSFHPDLILLDLMLPKISGFDVLDILRNTPETAKTIIVMLTARGGANDQQRAMELGANAYLIKSQVVIADVVAKIREELGLK